MEIIFLNPSAHFARFKKRAEAVARLGVKIKVLAFERESYPGRKWTLPFYSIGRIQHGNYLIRMIHLFKAFKIINKHSRKATHIYAFGLDMAIMGFIVTLVNSNNQKLVYEIGDIREIFLGNTVISKLLRQADKFVASHSFLMVVTSNFFISCYYKNRLGIQNLRFIEIENKLDEKQFSHKPASLINNKNHKKIRLGYFGVIRCKQSWELLKDIAKHYHHIHIVVYGVPVHINMFHSDIENIKNIHYYGPYVYPDDLTKIYNNVDIVWELGIHGKDNLKCAKRCRYYESLYFQRPMIAQRDTPGGDCIEKYDIGLCVDLNNPDETRKTIAQISFDDLNRWRQNMKKLPKHLSTYTNEHQILIEMLKSEKI